MYKLSVFIPDTHLEAVKSALFAAGAGQDGNYAHCCWQVQGIGQFMPLKGSQPHIGKPGTLTQVTEWRVETVVAEAKLHLVIAAFIQAHPYETPAYDVVKLVMI